jgi:diguanylate cyclase (GGDEF)-like protein
VLPQTIATLPHDTVIDPYERDLSAVARLRRLAHEAARRAGTLDRNVVDELLDAANEAELCLAEQARRIQHLESLSITDELTSILNRRGFESAFHSALAMTQRHGQPGLLLLCDLDHFKAINDTYGHLAGDAVLRGVAQLLRANTRRSDEVARLGGDEFAVLMRNTPAQRGERLVGKLDRLINRLVVEWQGHQIPVSASCGVEVFGRDSRADVILFLADRALYRRKPAGRSI